MNATKKRTTRVNRANRIKAAKNMPMAILLEKKAKTDAKALQIVEKLIEPAVDIEWMLENLAQINRTHLEDVADERAIGKICGYVLCDNELVKTVNKKFYISTLKNKVYDLEKMKNFCSFTCYSAMNHLMMQMFTSPLWLRAEEEIPKFTLLDISNKRAKSPPGIEINITGLDLPLDVDNSSKEETNKLDNTDNNVEKYPQVFTKRLSQKAQQLRPTNGINSSRIKSTDKQKTTLKTKINEKKILANNGDINEMNKNNQRNQELLENNLNDNLSESTKSIKNINGDDVVDMNNVSTVTSGVNEVNEISDSFISTVGDENLNVTLKKPTEKRIIPEQKLKKEKSTRNSVIFTETLAVRLQRCFDEWVTTDTYNFLNGKKTEEDVTTKKAQFDKKYTALCKRLDQLQFEDDDDDEEQETSVLSDNLKPAPHYAALKEQAKELEIKVRAFYSGQLETEMPLDTSKEEKNNQESGTVIPLTEVHAPNALRRRIFLDKLNKVLPNVLQTLAGSNQTEYLHITECMSLAKTIISTFNLTAKNIVFKTAEWTPVSLLIVKMLGLVDTKIKALLLEKNSALYLSMILVSYQLDSNYIDNLIHRFTISSGVNGIENLIEE